ncbi:hypothetical protein VTH82DRAFT_4579 [Thermothelomyces myriococcoides]
MAAEAGGCGGGGHPKAFLLYPLVYIVCTAPLALARIASMAGVVVPPSYFYISGALLGSNGWLDVLLWSVTRHRLLFRADVDEEDHGLDTFTFMRTPHGRRWGNMVWVQGGAGRGGEAGRETEKTTKEKLGDLLKRGTGWRSLFGFGGDGDDSSGGGGGGGSGTGTGDGRNSRASGHDRHELGGGREEGLAIQMDMVTTVVVEQADAKEWEGLWGAPGTSTMHAPSSSAESNSRAYEDIELDDTLLRTLE